MLSYEMGCNYFHVAYPFDQAEKGMVIISNHSKFSEVQNKNKIESKNYTNVLDDNEDYNNLFKNKEIKLMDLNDKKYETDTSILKENCECFSCKNNYTKAYIHHLLKCKELNASILIAM